MDLYSCQIVGWYTSKRMTIDLICKAMIMVYNLRRPSKGLVFHSDVDPSTQVSGIVSYSMDMASGRTWVMSEPAGSAKPARGRALLWQPQA